MSEVHSPSLGFSFAVIAAVDGKSSDGSPRSGQQLARNEQRAGSPRSTIPSMRPTETKHGAVQNGVEPADVWKARRFIEQNSTDKISLAKVAEVVNVSPTHLSEKFKRVTGTNFVDYVARRRFANACELLLESDLPVSEIAFAVGFQSLSQFNRVFKRLSGKSPRAYRVSKLGGKPCPVTGLPKDC